jgi:Domain of unknown function (DUF4148)
MKQFFTALALVAASASVSAFAQTSQPATVDAQSQSSAASTPTEQWMPPYGAPVQQETRAQVYQDLVHAEQDGQLHYLNSTVYEGA